MDIKFEFASTFSAIPNVVHGFFTRTGGVSEGALSSLNCSSSRTNENPSNVAENRKRALAALGLDGFKLVVPNLAHGVDSLVIDPSTNLHDIASERADAAITSCAGIALGITYADCLPILLASIDCDVIAAVHAGWRGVKCDVIKATVEKITRIYGSKPLFAAGGPAISQQGFSVTGEVLEFFAKHWPRHTTTLCDQRGNVALTDIAIEQLREAGVLSIEKIGGFTDESPKNYFSHRRDRGETGRHIAIIAKRN